MSIDAIAAVSTGTSVPVEAAFEKQLQPASSLTFDSILGGLENLNTQLQASQNAVTQMALGNTTDLHKATIGAEQARLTFELMLAVRNKVLDAYQELMRMQV